MKQRWMRVLALLLAISLFAVACGSDDDPVADEHEGRCARGESERGREAQQEGSGSLHVFLVSVFFTLRACSAKVQRVRRSVAQSGPAIADVDSRSQ